jgi:hypothetical protein
MEITVRGMWTLVHGMGFGALYLLACTGALVEIYRTTTGAAAMTPGQEKFVRFYLLAMVVVAWFAVLTGAYIVYPWYRAVPPAGTTALAMFPQKLLMSSAHTSGWHSLGMEWKEHVAWFAPISITMAAAVFLQYGRDLKRHPQLRTAVLGFTMASFMAAGIAGFFGAMIDKVAPVQGGATITLSQGETK